MHNEITKKYNHLYFTEKSKDEADLKNNTFWIKLSDLENAYPNIKIIIAESLEDKWGHIYSVLQFECDNLEILKKIQDIYKNHWYPFPLELYPEFSHLKLTDILKEESFAN